VSPPQSPSVGVRQVWFVSDVPDDNDGEDGDIAVVVP